MTPKAKRIEKGLARLERFDSGLYSYEVMSTITRILRRYPSIRKTRPEGANEYLEYLYQMREEGQK
jgi:hypothetical protein